MIEEADVVVFLFDRLDDIFDKDVQIIEKFLGFFGNVEIHTVKLADQVSGVNWRREVPAFTGDLGRILPVLPNLIWLPM